MQQQPVTAAPGPVCCDTVVILPSASVRLFLEHRPPAGTRAERPLAFDKPNLTHFLVF
jgi:hypothetical protein